VTDLAARELIRPVLLDSIRDALDGGYRLLSITRPDGRDAMAVLFVPAAEFMQVRAFLAQRAGVEPAIVATTWLDPEGN
jgi:hypothetical protein